MERLVGQPLLEEFVYDRDGQMLSGTFADYLIATATGLPRVDAISVNLALPVHNRLARALRESRLSRG
jgi:CO/xanthine dehydrogenase Mo-binding subunit